MILADERRRGRGVEPMNLVSFQSSFHAQSINVPGTEQYFATPPSLNMPMASMVPAMIA